LIEKEGHFGDSSNNAFEEIDSLPARAAKILAWHWE